MVNVTKRELGQIWGLRAEGVISHELPLESGKLTNKEIHHSLRPNNFVPVRVPRDVLACVDESNVDVDAILKPPDSIISELTGFMKVWTQTSEI